MNRRPSLSRTPSRALSRGSLSRSKSTKAAMNAVQLMIAMQIMQEMAKRTRGATARNRNRVGRPGPNRTQLRAAAARRRL
jgi:hypothetical protein